MLPCPRFLKENGYTTFFAGKCNLGSEADPFPPTDHGFDINQGGMKRAGPYAEGYFFRLFNNPQMKRFYPEEKGNALSMKVGQRITSAFIGNKKGCHLFGFIFLFYAVHSPITNLPSQNGKV